MSDDLLEAAIRAVDNAREDFLLAKTAENKARLRKVAISVVHGALLANAQRDQWQDMSTAPLDGTIVNVVGRYPEATSGFPRYAGYLDGQWLEYSRFQPQPIICWAWRPRGDWPREGTPT